MAYTSALLRATNPAPRPYRLDGPSAQAEKIDIIRTARAPQPQGGSPIAFARSALFAVAGVGEMVRGLALPVGAKVDSLTFTGPRLGQQHALVWQTLVAQ